MPVIKNDFMAFPKVEIGSVYINAAYFVFDSISAISKSDRFDDKIRLLFMLA